MVNNQIKLNKIFSALADRTRRDMIERLTQNQLTASELAEKYRISFPAVSKHLRILRESGLVKDRRSGRQHIFAVNSNELNRAKDWVQHWSKYWNAQLDNLEKFLSKNN